MTMVYNDTNHGETDPLTRDAAMKNIRASEFKAKCLKIMDEVARTGEEVVITKNGKAISKLVPFREPVASLFGTHEANIDVNGDIVAPLDIGWDADA